MDLCLLAAGATIRLGTTVLTLAWTHSIEKTRWEEDFRATTAGLTLVEDRIQGTGAGMEPPPDATFDGKWWHYKLANQPPLKNVVLRRSGATADWQVCIGGACKPMGEYVGKDADPVTLTVCP